MISLVRASHNDSIVCANSFRPILQVNTRVSTIQADMCKKLKVEFTKKELYNQLVWAAVYDLTLTFRDAAG